MPIKQIEDYTEEEIEQYHNAFERVCNPINWKKPIKKIIEISSTKEIELITSAIIWFTGSMPEFKRLKNNKYLITADGYYIAIGA